MNINTTLKWMIVRNHHEPMSFLRVTLGQDIHGIARINDPHALNTLWKQYDVEISPVYTTVSYHQKQVLQYNHSTHEIKTLFKELLGFKITAMSLDYMQCDIPYLQKHATLLTCDYIEGEGASPYTYSIMVALSMVGYHESLHAIASKQITPVYWVYDGPVKNIETYPHIQKRAAINKQKAEGVVFDEVFNVLWYASDKLFWGSSSLDPECAAYKLMYRW